MHYLLGIDEAGRWPWAWPIVAGWFLIETSLLWEVFSWLSWLTDSKLLDEKNRERICMDISQFEKAGKCSTRFALRDASEIDRLGIREANRQCMEEVIGWLIEHISSEDQIEIYIDGCDNYEFQIPDITYRFAKKKRKNSDREIPALSLLEAIRILTYVIAGDKSVPVISAASVIAKVSRDRLMCEYSEKFPVYGFETHKGYGTKKHRDALINYGITSIHRKSYEPIKRLILWEW